MTNAHTQYTFIIIIYSETNNVGFCFEIESVSQTCMNVVSCLRYITEVCGNDMLFPIDHISMKSFYPFLPITVAIMPHFHFFTVTVVIVRPTLQ